MREEQFKRMLEILVEKKHKEIASKIQHRFQNPSDAEDALQSAYCEALRYWESYVPEYGSFDAWFGRILQRNMMKTSNFYYSRGTTATHATNQNRQSISFVPMEERLGSIVVGEGETLILASKLAALIEEESDSHSVALNLYFIHGLDPKSITNWVPLKKKNVEMIIFRFKKKLKEVFSDYQVSKV